MPGKGGSQPGLAQARTRVWAAEVGHQGWGKGGGQGAAGLLPQPLRHLGVGLIRVPPGQPHQRQHSVVGRHCGHGAAQRGVSARRQRNAGRSPGRRRQLRLCLSFQSGTPFSPASAQPSRYHPPSASLIAGEWSSACSAAPRTCGCPATRPCKRTSGGAAGERWMAPAHSGESAGRQGRARGRRCRRGGQGGGRAPGARR